MRIRTWITTAALLAASATTLAACSNERSGKQQEATGAALSMQLSDDVAAFNVIVTRVSCHGEAFTGFSHVFPSALLDLNISSKVTADGSTHSFADTFISLEAGCYDIISQPLKADGTPSADCAIAGMNDVLVLDGLPTEIVLISQCSGQVEVGGLDTILLLNHPPQLEDMWYPQGKFVAHCDSQQICARFKDPDGDPLEVVWSKKAGLPGTTLAELSPVPSPDGSVAHCVEVTHGGVEMMLIEAKAYDLMKDPSGPGLIRFEQFYADNGIPATSNDAFLFQAYGASSASCPCAPHPEICDGVDNNCDGHSDEGLTGCVCVPGDHDACYDGPPGTSGVGMCHAGVKVCEPDGSGSGACLKQVLPEAEVCGDGADNDCDGVVDNGCACGNNVCDAGETHASCPSDCHCGNNVCDEGETAANCPEDCPPVLCGNGTCGTGETHASCPEDCPVVCGDGACDTGETHASCPEDCPVVCGDGACDTGETHASCPEDCPVLCGNGVCESGEACGTCPGDCGACGPVCGNGVCESGEACGTCPGDCGSCGPVCGNGVCESGETCGTCPGDCGSCGPVCGNGACEAGETCGTCPGDCGSCGPVCGNGACEAGETCSSCPGDCGSCGPVCGDGVCDPGETCGTCAVDCPMPTLYGYSTCEGTSWVDHYGFNGCWSVGNIQTFDGSPGAGCGLAPVNSGPTTVCNTVLTRSYPEAEFCGGSCGPTGAAPCTCGFSGSGYTQPIAAGGNSIQGPITAICN